MGISNLFADIFKNNLRYVKNAKSWYYYDGCRWNEDVGGAYEKKFAKVLTRYLEIYKEKAETK